VTQLMSPSSRHGRGEPDARHATHHHFGYGPVPEPLGNARGRHATPRGQGFERVVGWTILGSIIPGAGLIAAGRRVAGGFALTVATLVAIGLGAFLLTVDRVRFAASFLADPNKILIAAGLFVVLVLGWITIVLSTHAATRRYSSLTGGQRVLAATLVAALIGVVGVPTLMGAEDALLASDTIRTMFKGSGDPLSGSSKGPDAGKPDPWANVPRINVLLMGGDSGLDRTGIRPDTMIVASIDTKTGNTVLVSLPRNLERTPFPPGSRGAGVFPNGFYCYNASAGTNTECLLNALWTWGDDHPDYYPGDNHPGLTATVDGIEQVTGLKIDEYVMLNLRGFEDFVNAIGGLDINIKQRLPIGGSSEHRVASAWLKPGRRHLNGYYALWYARSRWSTSDFDRMNRQRCVIGAVVQQANPASVALGFSKIMKTLRKNFLTSIPLEDVDAWVTLALRVKKAKVTSLTFTNEVINTGNPDIDKMHRLVQQAINPPPKATASTTPSPTKTKTKTKTVTSTTVEAGQAADLNAVC
jgi:LCP family protein required for cell wall assembly